MTFSLATKRIRDRKSHFLELREVEGSLSTLALATSNTEALSHFFQFHFNSSLKDAAPSHISFCERFLFRETKIIQQLLNDL
jgi:gluconate kinase